ncbi:MAG: hypothetical protein KAJ51_01975 [Thermoplasmata archaeon]|nr:hypothetical protein [Thermoplasmata archaeon]
MDKLDPTIYSKQKKLKKLIKLLDGKGGVPASHRSRIETQIASLSSELGTDNIDSLKKQYSDLNLQITAKTEPFEFDGSLEPINFISQVSSWYLRPLISNFDSPKKVKALKTKNEGLGGLKNEISLYLTPEIWSADKAELRKNLRFYFQFKSMGKGQSQPLTTAFYKLFKFTPQNPFEFTTLGKNNLPVFYYNTDTFSSNLDSSESSIIVTGLCPLSGISDEILFVSSSGESWRPALGFEPLPLPPGTFKLDNMVWPLRPILSDYIAIKNYIEILKYYTERYGTDKVKGLIWYPNMEYLMDFTDVIFSKWLDEGLIAQDQIIGGFNELQRRYQKLLGYVTQAEDYNGKLELRTTRNEDINEFENILTNLDLSHIKNIYGVWNGPELRQKLYLYLILKHIFPTLDGFNALHLETSYELWPNVQGTKLIEDARAKTEGLGTYSWICYPSTPSLSMSYMRDYNAPHNDKLYLVEQPDLFEQKLKSLSINYILYVAPQIFNFDQIKGIDKLELRELFIDKLHEINKTLNS